MLILRPASQDAVHDRRDNPDNPLYKKSPTFKRSDYLQLEESYWQPGGIREVHP